MIRNLLCCLCLLTPPMTMAEDAQTYQVTGVDAGDTLNIRSGPGTDFPVVAALVNGDDGIKIRGEAVRKGNEEWVPIDFHGQKGWTRSKFLKATASAGQPMEEPKPAVRQKPKPAVEEPAAPQESVFDDLVGYWLVDVGAEDLRDSLREETGLSNATTNNDWFEAREIIEDTLQDLKFVAWEIQPGTLVLYRTGVERARIKVQIKAQDHSKRTVTVINRESPEDQPYHFTIEGDRAVLTMEKSKRPLKRISRAAFLKELAKYPEGTPVPDRPGFIYSPHNKEILDVRGMASGSLVLDPRYREEEEKYIRVP